MLTNLRQRVLHLASVKLATLTQVAGVNDPTRQCAALRNTTALLQHVLRYDIQLLVGRHLDHVVLAALFCVCQVQRCVRFHTCNSTVACDDSNCTVACDDSNSALVCDDSNSAVACD